VINGLKRQSTVTRHSVETEPEIASLRLSSYLQVWLNHVQI